MIPSVFTIVVNWNGRRQLLDCLSSLERTDYPMSKLSVVVIDNASTDGSQEAIRQKFPRVALVENSCNLGYVEAVNSGAEIALKHGADYLWILNNDVIVYPDTLRNLLKAAAGDPGIAVAGPVIYAYSDDQRVEHAGYKINPWIGYLKKLRYGIDIFRGDEEEADVDSILGCSNLIKADAWLKVGCFDPVYDIYFEETDFNARARRQGWRVVLVKNARVRHESAATMNRHLRRRAWLLLRNLFIFQRRNAQSYHLLVFAPYFFLVHVPYFLVRGLHYGFMVKLKQRME
jgi:GT2 family glycosyltransferase